MEFSRQEYWSGLPFPSPGGLPDPGIKPQTLALQTDSLPSEPVGESPEQRWWWLRWEAVGVQVVSADPVDIGGER